MRAPTYYPPVLFEAEEAAAYIAVSVRSLTDLQKAGEIIPRKFGAKRLFHRDDLEKWASDRPDWERQ